MDSERGQQDETLNPRTKRVQRVILDAAVELLLQHGAQDVTALRVAERAEVARTTVYRHWPDQPSLLLATVDALTTPHHHPPTAGPVAESVPSVLGSMRARLVARDVRSVFGALAAQAAGDDAFAEAQRRFIQQLTQPIQAVLEAAQQRGELEDALDCTLEATFLAAPILHRYLALHAEVDDGLIDETVQRWLATHGLGLE